VQWGVIGGFLLVLIGIGVLVLVVQALLSHREEKADRAAAALKPPSEPAVTGPRFGPGPPRRGRGWDDSAMWPMVEHHKGGRS
jgi:hypothetical protein